MTNVIPCPSPSAREHFHHHRKLSGPCAARPVFAVSSQYLNPSLVSGSLSWNFHLHKAPQSLKTDQLTHPFSSGACSSSRDPLPFPSQPSLLKRPPFHVYPAMSLPHPKGHSFYHTPSPKPPQAHPQVQQLKTGDTNVVTRQGPLHGNRKE